MSYFVKNVFSLTLSECIGSVFAFCIGILQKGCASVSSHRISRHTRPLCLVTGDAKQLPAVVVHARDSIANRTFQQ